MDDATKERFKLKFYSLAVIINVIVLIIAGAVVVYLKGPPDLNEVLAVVLAAIAIVMAFFFVRRYRETKAWLDEHP
jgi:positive regulator of sigma E activity